MNENTNMTETRICHNCGRTGEDLVDLHNDGRLWCPECLEEAGYHQCEDCDEWTDDGTYIDGYGWVCEDCLNYNYTYCSICEEYVPNDDIVTVNRGTRSEYYVCRDCVNRSYDIHQCRDCGEYFDDAYISYLEGVDEYICHNCQCNYSYCESCNEYVNSDDIVYDDEEDEYVCSECYNRNHAESNDSRHKLQNYSYKPTPKPRTRKRNCSCDTCSEISELLFGLELEVDKGPSYERDATISEIADASEDVYMKHDGSLDTGFEIVTHPCTLEYHMYEFVWRHITSIAKRHGFKSHDARTCGLHVHVGRYQLGQDDRERHNNIAKIILLVDRHWDALVKFSRRTDSQLNHWAKRPSISRPHTSDTEARVIERMWSADNGDRYQAVNLRNSGTIEFRMFNGTLKRDTIVATIQLLSNMCQYAMTHGAQECLASTWDDITTYKTWEELKAYCESNNLVGISGPAPFVLGGAPARELRIGDRVRLHGGTGTIVADHGSWSELRYGVRMDEGYAFGGCHTLGGLLREDLGWWATEDELELIA